ncbi:MAG: alpha/beta hydrolase [Clostridia bacterium]|nr:alpha/beta hydrolase [Clostridia bacterium]
MESNNPEAKFRRFPADYSGMKREEAVFAKMLDPYGVQREYWMDILSPLEADGTLRPVILFAHGGAFQEPCDRRQAYISHFAQKLIPAGFTVASPDYPLFHNEEDRMAFGDEYAQSGFAAEGILKAAKFLKEHAQQYHLDANQMILMGGSAGGIGGFHALCDSPDTFALFVNLWGAPETIPDVSGFPPVYSIHGTDDALVPYEREIPLQKKLEEHGIPHVLHTIEGAGHTPIPQAMQNLPALLAFIRRHL